MSDEKKRRIGRGLSSLLGDLTLSDFEPSLSGDATNSIQNILLSNIIPNPLQPRKSFNEDEIKELAQSITENGILQPIIVQNNNDGTYGIIAGERRFRASKIAGLQTIPCMVKNINQDQSFIIAMIENIQRSNLNPLEEGLGYKTLSENFGISHGDIAKMVGKSRSHISNMIGLLSIPTEVKNMLTTGEISAGHIKVLKRIDDPTELTKIAQQTKEWKLSVRDLEKQLNQNRSKKIETQSGQSIAHDEANDASQAQTNRITNKDAEINVSQIHANPTSHHGLQNFSFNHTNVEDSPISVSSTHFATTPHNNSLPAYSSHWVPSDILAMEDAFNAKFQQMMHIQHDNIDNAGKIVIHYADIEELRDIISKLIDLSDVYAK